MTTDIRLALRQIRRQRRLAIAIVRTLGVAIDSNVAVFAAAHALRQSISSSVLA